MKAGQTNVLQAHTPQLFRAAVDAAAALLRNGELVALPTETVYGLAANALSGEAVARIFTAKGRPPNNPIIVHVSDIEMARRCASEWPAVAQKLADAFWPGPLTLVLRKAAIIPGEVSAGGDTVGIRWPAHPIMQAVIQACGFPLAAPSANVSNQLSPTNASHVLKQLGGKIPLIIDGGQSNVGIESTVLDLTERWPQILRPGMIHEPALLSITGPLSSEPHPEAGRLKSPGLLAKHYSPRARLIIHGWHSDSDLLAKVAAYDTQPGKAAIVAHTNIPSPGCYARVGVVPRDPHAYARALYAELHECDESGANLIIVESPPEGPEWNGVRDRLIRAASG